MLALPELQILLGETCFRSSLSYARRFCSFLKADMRPIFRTHSIQSILLVSASFTVFLLSSYTLVSDQDSNSNRPPLWDSLLTYFSFNKRRNLVERDLN